MPIIKKKKFKNISYSHEIKILGEIWWFEKNDSRCRWLISDIIKTNYPECPWGQQAHGRVFAVRRAGSRQWQTTYLDTPESSPDTPRSSPSPRVRQQEAGGNRHVSYKAKGFNFISCWMKSTDSAVFGIRTHSQRGSLQASWSDTRDERILHGRIVDQVGKRGDNIQAQFLF